MYQRSWIRLKHGLDSVGLSGSINSAEPFQPKSEQKEAWLSSPCSAVSAVTRPVIIHRFGGGGWEGNVLKWMLLRRWHSFEKVEAVLICTACYRSVIHAFLAALSQFYHGLSDYGAAEPLPASSLFTLFIPSLSVQPVRWVSISRWQAMVCVVNVLNTATQRPELPSPAPATPTTIERQMTHQRLLAPVSTNTEYTR